MGFLSRALADASDRSSSQREQIRASVFSKAPSQNTIGGGGSSSLNMQAGRYSQTQQHHADQYGYFAGYPFAIINSIANRLAAQPIRVGRILPAGRKPPRGRGIKRCGDYETFGTDGWLVPKYMQEIADRVEILPNHKISRVITNPNPIMVRHHLLYSTFASIEITGLAYWWMYNNKEEGAQIWPIPTHWMEPVHEEGKLFAFYRMTFPGTGQVLKIPTRQVAMFLAPDPSDPFGAYPVMQAMSKSVMTDWAFEMAQRMSLENGLNPGLAIMVGKPPGFAGVEGDQMVLTKEQRQQIISAVRRQYRGVTRFDEPMILDALIRDVKKISNSPAEMAFKDSGPLVRDRLCQGWNMNPITLGEIQGVNYASSGVADHHVVRSVFKPRCEVNSQTMTKYVGPYFGGQSVDDERIEGDLVVYQEPVTPSDPEQELQRDWGDFDRGIISRNEIRRRRGLESIKGGGYSMVQGVWVNVDGDGDKPDDGIPIVPEVEDSEMDGEQEEEKEEGVAMNTNKGINQRGIRGSDLWRKVTDDQGHEHGNDGRFTSGGGGASSSSGDRNRHGTGNLDTKPEEHASIAKKLFSKIKKAGEKAVDTAKKTASMMHDLAYQVSWHVMTKNLAEEICDTSHDYSKLINAKGTGDWLSTNLGVSGNFAAVVSSHVLAYGYTKFKKALAARRAKNEEGKSAVPLTVKELSIKKKAKYIHEVVTTVLSGMGCPDDELPTVKDVVKYLKKKEEEAKEEEEKEEEEDDKDDKKGFRLVRSTAFDLDAFAIQSAVDVQVKIYETLVSLGQGSARLLREVVKDGHEYSPKMLADTAIDTAIWEERLRRGGYDSILPALLSGGLSEWSLYQRSQSLPVNGQLPASMLERVQDGVRTFLSDEFIRGFVDWTKSQVEKSARKLMAKGVRGSALAEGLSEVLVGEGCHNSARRFARTAGFGAFNKGQYVVRSELVKRGSVAGVRWVCIGDGKTRSSHREANGQTIAPDKRFRVGEFQCRYPGDMELPEHQRNFCRCKAVSIFRS